MIHGLVRSPSWYFDITPTGRLNNKFSNDLGIMDGTLAGILSDAIEGPIISLILVANVFSINIYFMIPGLIDIVFVVAFFLFCKNGIILAKQLDLRLKTPVFHMVGEMVSGLIQIRIFNRRSYLLNEFAKKVNQSLQGTICFWNCSRGFGTNLSYFSIFIIWIGWIIGVAVATPQNAELYGVSVVFLLSIGDYLQWFLRQIIVLESTIVSVERAFIVADLPAEKELRN